jgi:hypothetical protein
LFTVITRKKLIGTAVGKTFEDVSLHDIAPELDIIKDLSDIILFVDNGKIKILKKFLPNITFSDKMWNAIKDMEKILHNEKIGWFD